MAGSELEPIGSVLLSARSAPAQRKTCPVHGEYVSENIVTSLFDVWSACGRCEQEREQVSAAAAAERRRVDTEARFKDALVPKRFRAKTLEAFAAPGPAQRKVLAIARRYRDTFPEQLAAGRCLILVGPTGTGKTHLVAGILNGVLGAGHTGLYRTALDTVRMLRDTWRPGAPRPESQVLDALASVDLLAIDEVGVQHWTDSERVLLTEVIGRRYADVKPTIVASNEDLAGLERCIGDRAHDRLRENGGTVLVCAWQSYRAAGAARADL